MKFNCKKCNTEKNIYKVKFVSVGSDLVCKDAQCCNEFMEQIITDEYKGMPEVKRNEEHMQNGDRLWNDFKYNNTEK